MIEEKILCPYCGPWNEHPDGVEMEPKNVSGLDVHWMRCNVCGNASPVKKTPEEARAAARRRFQPLKKPLTLEEVERVEDLLWICKPDTCCPYLIYARDISEGQIRVFDNGGWLLCYRLADYGKKWVAFENRPTDKECIAARLRMMANGTENKD